MNRGPHPCQRNLANTENHEPKDAVAASLAEIRLVLEGRPRVATAADGLVVGRAYALVAVAGPRVAPEGAADLRPVLTVAEGRVLTTFLNVKAS